MDKSSKLSSELMCCRGCLATGVNLFDIYKNQLAEAFECITGYSVLSQDGLPQQLCGVCGTLLAKSAAFRDRCRRAHHCLQRLHQDKLTMDYIKTVDRLSHNLMFTLALSPVEAMDMGTSPCKIKDELPIVVKESIFKDELDPYGLDVDEHSHSPIDDVPETLDDESDVVKESKKIEIEQVLLPTDKVEVKKRPNRKRKVELKNKKKDEHKHSPIDAVPEILDDDKSDEVKELKKVEIEQVLIPTDKVEVKKRPNRKRKVERKNKKKELKKRRIFGPSPTNYEPNFDVAELEKELNVDVEILNKEQQLEDWRQMTASKKMPAAFSCQECGKGFNQSTSYKNHLLRHSPSAGRFACEVCLVRFRCRSERRLHRNRHALRFTCRVCKFVARVKTQAKQHSGTHEGKKYQCKHCEKTFVKRTSYFSHVRLLHAAQNVTCGECGETFVSRLGLTLHHTKTHKAQKAASKCACASCGVTFDNAEALDAHARATEGRCDPANRPCAACGASLATDEALRTHTEECHKKEFKCTECPLVFAGAEPRDTHYWRVHLAMRRSVPSGTVRGRSRVCPQCGKKFTTSSLLDAHMLIHTGEKPWGCEECPLRFNCRANLQRHHRVVHLGQRPMVKCGECGKRLGTASIATHIKYVHRKVPQKQRIRKKLPMTAAK